MPVDSTGHWKQERFHARELIDTGTDKRFVRRDKQGQKKHLSANAALASSPAFARGCQRIRSAKGSS